MILLWLRLLNTKQTAQIRNINIINRKFEWRTLLALGILFYFEVNIARSDNQSNVFLEIRKILGYSLDISIVILSSTVLYNPRF